MNMFTKPLSRMNFEYFRDELDVVPLQRECSHPARKKDGTETCETHPK
jgi:hypothetical protein